MSGKMTELIVTDTPRGARRWAWGHVAAERTGSNNLVRLKVTEPDLANPKSSATWTSPGLLPSQALAAGDCLRAAAGNAPATMCGGKSLHEMLWDELMTIVERLMTGQESEDGRDPGRAEGVAYAIAVFTNPYAPNLEAIREQAMDRWEEEDNG